MTEQALTVVEQTWSVPDAPTVKARFQAIAAFQHFELLDRLIVVGQTEVVQS